MAEIHSEQDIKEFDPCIPVRGPIALLLGFLQWRLLDLDERKILGLEVYARLAVFLKNVFPWVKLVEDKKRQSIVGGCHDDLKDMDMSLSFDIRCLRKDPLKPSDYLRRLEKETTRFFSVLFGTFISIRFAQNAEVKMENSKFAHMETRHIVVHIKLQR